ncbi:zinc finger protein 513 [Galendromus occidentalis]|uniref:Zinc finger protein 513 n=1 Tax=Galendromus occidentalis TaxID=34638 RepID=A0AAJ6QT07_9ACAR|nr:zinc finger protein 513 [Galendromus occidentalis]
MTYSGVDGDYDGCLENVNPEVFGMDLKAVKPLYIVTKRSDGERIYLCDFCGYETRYKNVVTDHVRKHTGERPFVCPYCDFRCSQKPNWRRHIRRIHVGKPYYLNDPSSLPRERVPRIDFNCSMCDYSSSVPGAELVHMSIHLNDTI